MVAVKIKTLTPVHIGSGRELSRNVEFLYMKNKIGVIDEKKILQQIGEENIGLWVSMIEKGDKDFLGYLLKRNPSLKLAEVSKRTMPLFANNFEKIKTLKEQLIDGMGHPYIPGSSIKGSIRTAIFNILLAKWGRSWEEYQLKDRYGKFSDKTIQSQLFGKDPNHDIGRFLKVGDARFNKNSLIARSVLSMNYKFNNTIRDNNFFQLTEAIAADEETKLSLKIDANLWEKNIYNGEIRKPIPDCLKDYKSLFGALNSFTKELVEKEVNFWERYENLKPVENYLTELNNILSAIDSCTQKETVIRLGHGSGWIFMTGGWTAKEELITKELYEKILFKARPHNEKYKGYFFPKTRRMDEDGELLGFVKLTLEN